MRHLKGATALLLLAAACTTGGEHQDRVVLTGTIRETRGPVAEAIVAVRTQHIEEIPYETLGLAALRSLEALPPKRAIRVVEAGYGATIVQGDSRSPGATLAVSWPPNPSSTDMLRAVQQASDFVRTRLGASADDVNNVMLRGLMTLDDDGAYLDPAQYTAVKNGAQVGVGVDVTHRDRGVTVVAPIEGGPAERAGLRAGDRILQVDGVSTERMKPTDAIGLLSGRPGSTAKLTVARREWPQPREIAVVRAPVRARSVESKVLGPGIAYVRVRRFQDSTGSEVTSALDTLRAAGARRIVLDLRVNSGGPMTAAIAVAEQFLPAGKLLAYTESRTKQQNLRFDAHAKRAIVDGPLAVLVDDGTAAGAELVAAALQEWQRATLVGTTTQGRASIQTLVPLSSGAGLRLTTARWYTPGGHSVDRRGLIPDVEVARGPDEHLRLGDPAQDSQLRRAVEVVRR